MYEYRIRTINQISLIQSQLITIYLLSFLYRGFQQRLLTSYEFQKTCRYHIHFASSRNMIYDTFFLPAYNVMSCNVVGAHSYLVVHITIIARERSHLEHVYDYGGAYNGKKI